MYNISQSTDLERGLLMNKNQFGEFLSHTCKPAATEEGNRRTSSDTVAAVFEHAKAKRKQLDIANPVSGKQSAECARLFQSIPHELPCRACSPADAHPLRSAEAPRSSNTHNVRNRPRHACVMCLDLALAWHYRTRSDGLDFPDFVEVLSLIRSGSFCPHLPDFSQLFTAPIHRVERAGT